jgi:hypothetical protein
VTQMNGLSNIELMRTLDDAWNAQDWQTYEKRHTADTVVFWPGQAEPTRGRNNHKAESVEFFKTFPDNHLVNHPYKVEIAQGDWTCTVADFTGTMSGPMKGSDGKLIAPTNKQFHVEFCTVARWKNSEIVEEKLFYDLVGLLKQIGVYVSACGPSATRDTCAHSIVKTFEQFTPSKLLPHLRTESRTQAHSTSGPVAKISGISSLFRNFDRFALREPHIRGMMSLHVKQDRLQYWRFICRCGRLRG